MHFKKITITQEQLIGVVCGTAAVFFLILALIIFIVQKKSRRHRYNDSEVEWFSSESCGRSDDEETQEIDETTQDMMTGQPKIYTHFEI